MDKRYVEAHVQEIRVLIFLISVTGKSVLNIGNESVAVVILMVLFSY